MSAAGRVSKVGVRQRRRTRASVSEWQRERKRNYPAALTKGTGQCAGDQVVRAHGRYAAAGTARGRSADGLYRNWKFCTGRIIHLCGD
jgi:hypothetical protein